MIRLTLKAKEERRLLRGHLWAYRNEFGTIPSLPDGAVADVFSAEGRFVGRGFYQARGGIAVRLVSRRKEEIGGAFLRARIESALAFRQTLFPEEDAYRWIFGESDGLPGLVADRYGAIVSAQTSCAFYASRAEALAEAFLEQPGVEGVRLDVNNKVSRFGSAENMDGPIECVSGGVRLSVDVESGQKTGMFLDQRENCLAMRRFAREARVLDGHCHIGQWSCHAALAGAASVLGVDTSGLAIEAAQRNAERNGVAGQCNFEEADIADVLDRGEHYDIVLIDPPGFAKTRQQAKKAQGLYLSLNAAAMKAVRPGGILVTSTCSHFVPREDFLETLKRAAISAQRTAWILEVRGASPDHPVLTVMPETEYLTCVFLRVF